MRVRHQSQKPNVKHCKNADLMLPQYSAPPLQRTLILAAVLVCWGAIVCEADTARAQSVPPYPIGVWGAYGAGPDIDPGVAANLGIVGIGISVDWDTVETTPGVYDWSG